MTGTAENKIYQESKHEAVAMLLRRRRSLVGLWVADNANDPADGTFALAEVSTCWTPTAPAWP